jgi:hypothetical protein
MTKFLDTYETWEKTFKIARTEDDDLFICYVHDNTRHNKQSTIIRFTKEEIEGLSEFLNNFLTE